MIEWRKQRVREHQHIASELINHFLGGQGLGIEIGVAEGQTSYHLLSNTEISHLYMIDPWKTWKGWCDQEQCDKDYEQVCGFEKEFPGRTTTIRKKSEDAVNDVPNELDFIWIDGSHDYEFVKKDLELYVPKVKSSGLIIGHDWEGYFAGVIKAVTGYFTDNNCIEPPFEDYKQFNFKWKHTSAPNANPIINKSWPQGHVWWAIKK